MLILHMAALALAGGVLSLALRKEQPAFAFLLSVGVAALLLAALAGELGPLLSFVRTLAAYGQGTNAGCLLRVLGIALVAQFAADTCRDAGMAAAASSVELCGRVLAMAQALPLLQTLVDALLSFLQ